MKAQNNTDNFNPEELHELAQTIKLWAKELGFQATGITDTDLTIAEQRFNHWLEQQMHGEMAYMSRHGSKRTRPAELEQGTLSIICVRMDYFPEDPEHAIDLLEQTEKGYIARYSLGRDYHKVVKTSAETGLPPGAENRALWLPGFYRQRSGTGKTTGRKSRTGLDRQAFQRVTGKNRFLVFFR